MSHFYPDLHHARLQEILRRLPKEIVLDTVTLSAEFACTPEPVPYSERLNLPYRPIREGETWGTTWDCGWFRLRGQVPAEWAGAYVTARLDFGGEALVFEAQGVPKVGLTNGSVFDAQYSKDTVHLIDACKGGEKVDLWVETGCNGLFGVTRCADPEWTENKDHIHGRYDGRVVSIRLCRFDYLAWQLWLDLQVLEDLYTSLPETAARRAEILRVVSKALDALPTGGTVECRALLRPLFDLPTDPATIDVYGVGHAHIDTGWLWPVRETIRKCARTFATQLGLIERYPGYVFGASQAQLYAFTKQHYPGLFAGIRKAVAAGQWEVQGGMWVEADCNLIGGESMIRQFVHGKNFFRDEFGVDVRNLWLPDVFGYSGNLPQILRKAGMDYFLTQKLSWNSHNVFPHNTFIWRGIDGSEVLAHFPPEDNYNSPVTPSVVRKNEWNNKERGLVKEAICLFGIGNGGGGPKEEHVERALRCHNLNGCPRFHFGFAQPVLEKMATYRPDLGTWSGELYFELHRATLTTQADMKRWNRRAEEALRAAEMICAAAGLKHYPAADFDAMWKTLLINQFHDIIPGSSIHRVYEEAVPQLKQVVGRSRTLQAAAAARILRPDQNRAVIFNPSSTPFAGATRLPEGWMGAETETGEALPVQLERDAALAWINVPPQSFVTLRRAANALPAGLASQGGVLENALVRYEFDGNLRLVRAFDKEAGLDLVPPAAAGNLLELFEDRPRNWDAWDIDDHYRRMRVDEAKAETFERIDGHVRCGLCARLRVGQSTLTQRVWLGRCDKRLDFVTEVDWRESHKLLRVAFPTTLVTDRAAFEIQYGYVQRNTCDNTKWDTAQFEALGHRWADLSRRDYGVALLNDSKYGYRVKDGSLELSLLRAPTDPDPVADIGMHQFTYSLLPHTGDLVESDVAAHAAMINQGVELFAGFTAGDAALPVRVTGEGIEMAVLKRAEKQDALIVRVVETRGMPARGELVCANARAAIVETDLMEWKDAGARAAGRLPLTLSPFEIRTFKVL